MKLHIRYVTAFAYADPVWNSHNVLRACPLTDNHQNLVSYELHVEPRASISTYLDRWGTRVDAFSVRQPHTSLVLTAESVVDTLQRPHPEPAPRSQLDDERFRADHWLYLQRSGHTRAGGAVTEAAREAVAAASTVPEMVHAIDGLVHTAMDYRPGATVIGVDVDSVYDTRAGVCQDFSHLAIAMLRAVGVPARYVSGYFYAADATTGDSPVGEPITVQTHAWVEAAVPNAGWLAIDPTNPAPVDERHVVIGRGRDYDDVTPLRGVYSGRSEASLSVEVSMVAGTLGPRPLPVVVLPTVDSRMTSGQ